MPPLELHLLEARTVPADLRIVTYNIAAADGAIRDGLVGVLGDGPTTNDHGILDTIGIQNVNGLTRPPDVILLQETDTGLIAVNAVATKLNSYYGAGTYAAGPFVGGTTGSGTQGIVFRTATVDLLESIGVGAASATGMPRQPIRYKISPDGSATDIYLYNSHMKADTMAGDADRRLLEVQALRANAATLPATANIIYAGDFNFYYSDASEPAYDEFFLAGNGKAVDVINPAGNWVRNSNAWDGLYTQAPLNSPPPGLTGGGLDDRFDFLLMSTDLNDTTAAEYRANSYHTFGNDGSLTANSDITLPSNTALNNTPLNATERMAVLNYLGTASDHLPVVADFTVPTGPTAVSSYTINNGAQRSRVTLIAVTFNAPVLNQLTAANFSLAGFAGTLNVSHNPGYLVATVSFAGPGTTAGSLNDSLYTLIVTVPGVTNNFLFNFHRLFGDANGDHTVDAGDFAAFGSAFGSTNPNSIFDFDGNNTVDAGDLSHFGARFGLTI